MLAGINISNGKIWRVVLYSSKIVYEVLGTEMHGFVAYDDKKSGPRPAVVIAHAWRGLDDFAREKAVALAEMGYVGFAADVYGEGVNAENDEESMALMLPLFENRKLLQQRINAAVDLVRDLPQADENLVSAIGFCFGGLTVLELLRSGADIRAAISFHGVLADVLGEVKAKRPPNGDKLKGAALFLHGHDDPMVSDTDIKKVLHELDEANVDWQFNIYGHTMHAFTNPMAQDADKGTVYQPQAAKRSWQTMENYLIEQFNIKKEPTV
jgi:dienelactone hydrolase